GWAGPGRHRRAGRWAARRRPGAGSWGGPGCRCPGRGRPVHCWRCWGPARGGAGRGGAGGPGGRGGGARAPLAPGGGGTGGAGGWGGAGGGGGRTGRSGGGGSPRGDRPKPQESGDRGQGSGGQCLSLLTPDS